MPDSLTSSECDLLLQGLKSETTGARGMGADLVSDDNQLGTGIWSQIAHRLEHELCQTLAELTHMTFEPAADGTPVLRRAKQHLFHGPLEPFGQALGFECDEQLVLLALHFMLGGSQDDLARDLAPRTSALSPFERRLADRFATRLANQFCEVVHQLSGVPLAVEAMQQIERVDDWKREAGPLAGGRRLTITLRYGAGLAPLNWWVPEVLCEVLDPNLAAAIKRFGLSQPTEELTQDAQGPQVVLTEIELPTSDLKNLAVGDQIELDGELNDRAIVQDADGTLLSGRIVTWGGQKVLQVGEKS